MELKSIINITVTVIICAKSVRVCALQKTDDDKNVKKQKNDEQRSASSVKKM